MRALFVDSLASWIESTFIKVVHLNGLINLFVFHVVPVGVFVEFILQLPSRKNLTDTLRHPQPLTNNFLLLSREETHMRFFHIQDLYFSRVSNHGQPAGLVQVIWIDCLHWRAEKVSFIESKEMSKLLVVNLAFSTSNACFWIDIKGLVVQNTVSGFELRR